MPPPAVLLASMLQADVQSTCLSTGMHDNNNLLDSPSPRSWVRPARRSETLMSEPLSMSAHARLGLGEMSLLGVHLQAVLSSHACSAEYACFSGGVKERT